MHHTILIVDDDPLQQRLLEEIIERKLHYKAITKSAGKEAIAFLTSEEAKEVDLVLLDLSMPEVDGFAVLEAVKKQRPDLPFIIITAMGDVPSAVKAMKAGVVDFIEKEESPEHIELSIQNALQGQDLREEVERLKRTITGQVQFSDIIATSPIMHETITIAQKAAGSNITVLVKGDSGVGKELFARSIHGSSGRAGKQFIAVNCGAIPENLVESTLFGHEKGSFTGAVGKSLGKFREADGGTLFLDEVGELTPDIQVKLLRALQEGEVEPVGGKEPVKVDVRVISATNRSLKEEVNEGRFREDLYYRLNVFPITVPPLYERGDEDVDMLLEHFCSKIAAMENKKILGFTPEAKELLVNYTWPGNVRQLENAVFRAVVLCQTDHLDVDDFSQIKNVVEKGVTLSEAARLAQQENATTDAVAADGAAPPVVDGAAGAPVTTALGEHALSLVDDGGDFKPLGAVEGEVIKAALTHYNWRMSKVARQLGIGRSTLYRKIQELGIESPNGGE